MNPIHKFFFFSLDQHLFYKSGPGRDEYQSLIADESVFI